MLNLTFLKAGISCVPQAKAKIRILAVEAVSLSRKPHARARDVRDLARTRFPAAADRQRTGL